MNLAWRFLDWIPRFALTDRLGPDFTKGDVVIPTHTPPNTTSISVPIEDIETIIARAVRYGVSVNALIEDHMSKLGCYGTCEMNGDVCTAQTCRQCNADELKSLLRDAVMADVKSGLFEHLCNKRT